jgi:hypothetical protein
MAVEAGAATTTRAVIGTVKLESGANFVSEENGYFEASDSTRHIFAIEGADAETVQSGKIAIQPQSVDAGGHTERAMFRDIDAILARVEEGVSVEHIRMDALLARLSMQGKR